MENSELQSGNSETAAQDVPVTPETPSPAVPKAEKPRTRKPRNSEVESGNGEREDLPTCADITRLIEHLEASDRPGVIARNAADALRQALAPLRQFEIVD